MSQQAIYWTIKRLIRSDQPDRTPRLARLSKSLLLCENEEAPLNGLINGLSARSYSKTIRIIPLTPTDSQACQNHCCDGIAETSLFCSVLLADSSVCSQQATIQADQLPVSPSLSQRAVSRHQSPLTTPDRPMYCSGHLLCNILIFKKLNTILKSYSKRICMNQMFHSSDLHLKKNILTSKLRFGLHLILVLWLRAVLNRDPIQSSYPKNLLTNT